jgi:hypothetical protein
MAADPAVAVDKKMDKESEEPQQAMAIFATTTLRTVIIAFSSLPLTDLCHPYPPSFSFLSTHPSAHLVLQRAKIIPPMGCFVSGRNRAGAPRVSLTSTHACMRHAARKKFWTPLYE